MFLFKSIIYKNRIIYNKKLTCLKTPPVSSSYTVSSSYKLLYQKELSTYQKRNSILKLHTYITPIYNHMGLTLYNPYIF